MGRLQWIVVIICIAVFSVSFGVAGWLLASASKDLSQEAQTRQRQFCRVLLSQHHDKQKRLRNTIEYLHTDSGHEPSAINEYIRAVSLPQTKVEVTKEGENLPQVCKEQEEK